VLDRNSLATYQLSGTIAYGEHAEGTYGSGSYGWSVFSYNEQAISLQTTDEQSTDSLNASGSSSGTTTLGGSVVNASGTFAAPGTGSNSLSCVQYANLSFHEVGSYTNGTWNLSCWVLDATTSLNATATQNQTDTSSTSGSSGRRQLQAPSGTVSVNQVNSSWANRTVHDEGTYAGGSLALSLVSFNLSGGGSFVYSTSQQQTLSGALYGADDFSASGWGNGSYTAQGVGSTTSDARST